MAEEPTEDTLWQLPPNYYDWLNGINAQWGFQPGVNAENVHLVFNASPFCTADSANKRFENLVNTAGRADLVPRYFNRRQCEEELAQYPGDSYVVIAGPERSAPEMNLLWVVRKQHRTITDRATKQSDVDVRGHYIVIADQIIAAPTLMDVLQSRWTASMLHLSNFYKTAASIPLYSIEKGYTYLHADQKKKPKDGGSSTRTSRAASPIADTASQTSTRLKHSTHIDDDFEIAHSFNLTLSYGDEFMDENPLIGEPGAFKLSSTGRTIKEKEAKEKAEEVRREKAVSETAIMSQIVAGSRVESPAITLAALPALKTNVERKSSVAVGKAKSPTSATGEGSKKRRKSKAPITPGAGGSS